MIEVWKSPRKIEEEVKQYRRDRFERQMQAVDRGEITRAMGIAALEDEIKNPAEFGASHE